MKTENNEALIRQVLEALDADVANDMRRSGTAITALTKLAERLAAAESEVAEWRTSIATEKLIERAEVAERERDAKAEDFFKFFEAAAVEHKRAKAAEARVKSLEKERDILFKGDWAALNLHAETAEARVKEEKSRADLNFFNMEAERQGREHYENQTAILEFRMKVLEEALERMCEAADPFVPEERYADELGDNLERAVAEGGAALKQVREEIH